MAIILGCGTVGKRLAKLEKNPVCICKTKKTEQNLSSQGFNAKALDITNNNTISNLSAKHIYYFIPPPSFGIKDTTISHFIKNINPDITKKILLISTTGVYGNCYGKWIDENQPLKPETDRAKRRIDAEKQLSHFCKVQNVDYTILRVPGIYGPEKLPITRLKNNKPILSLAESPFSNRIHIEDLVQIIYLVMKTQLPNKIYNIADNEPSSMSDYFIKVSKALGFKRPKEISLTKAKQELSENIISYFLESKRINNKAILKALNYQLKYPSLKEGLKDIS